MLHYIRVRLLQSMLLYKIKEQIPFLTENKMAGFNLLLTISAYFSKGRNYYWHCLSDNICDESPRREVLFRRSTA